MSVKTIIIGSHLFNVELEKLNEAIGVVRRETGKLRAYEGQLMQVCTTIESAWQSPAGFTFPPLQNDLKKAFDMLLTLLEEMARKMQATYDNYQAAESGNTHNLGG